MFIFPKLKIRFQEDGLGDFAMECDRIISIKIPGIELVMVKDIWDEYSKNSFFEVKKDRWISVTRYNFKKD